MKKTLTTILLFAGMASAWASGLPDGMPEGAYQATCTNINMAGNTLYATCRSGGLHDAWNPTNLDNANTCAIADNQNGQLVCLRQK